MPPPTLFSFVVRKEDRTITVERSFNAPLDPVWAAWTEPEILCQWWAPKPYTCTIVEMDFREGGRQLYYMEGPQGDRHYSWTEYRSIRPKTFFSAVDGFCDAEGVKNTALPETQWDIHFEAQGSNTVVRMVLTFASLEDLERIIAMGFQEGFTTGLEQLEQLLAERKH